MNDNFIDRNAELGFHPVLRIGEERLIYQQKGPEKPAAPEGSRRENKPPPIPRKEYLELSAQMEEFLTTQDREKIRKYKEWQNQQRTREEAEREIGKKTLEAAREKMRMAEEAATRERMQEEPQEKLPTAGEIDPKTQQETQRQVEVFVHALREQKASWQQIVEALKDTYAIEEKALRAAGVKPESQAQQIAHAVINILYGSKQFFTENDG